MTHHQSTILSPVPAQACFLTFDLNPEAKPRDIISRLGDIDIENTIVGIGSPLLDSIGCSIAGMSPLTQRCHNNITLVSTPRALWCYLQGEDRGELFHRLRRIINQLAPHLVFHACTDGFQYAEGRDLTGYEDGTENPEGEKALETAFLSSSDPDLDGSSFVVVQKWLHDFNQFEALSPAAQDDIIGRHRADNQEFDQAPESAHVKRTAQESFDPEAYLLRRSLPWAEGPQSGLMFVAFAHSFYPFETQIKRMLGEQDGIVDGLFQFTRPVDGAYYWCPPVRQGRLNLRALSAIS